MQRGKEEYKLAATSDGKEKKKKKGKKGEKDMDELKKEVDLVSTQTKAEPLCNYLKRLIRRSFRRKTLSRVTPVNLISLCFELNQLLEGRSRTTSLSFVEHSVCLILNDSPIQALLTL